MASEGKEKFDSVSNLQKELENLRFKLSEERDKLNDAELFATCQAASISVAQIRCRRVLKGHSSKVLDLDWCSDRRRLVSSSQNGKILVWDAYAAVKECMASLQTTWVNACAFAPTGDLIACGGLDNKCSVFPIYGGSPPSTASGGSGSGNNDSMNVPTLQNKKVVAMHTSYLSSCTFTESDHQLLTASGDGTCALWDVESSQLLQSFHGHQSDVMDVAMSPDECGNLFISGVSFKISSIFHSSSNHFSF